MVEVRFRRRRDGREEWLARRVPVGTTLLEAALDAGLPVARACRGDGLCARCGLEVLHGAEALTPEGPEEAEAKRRNRIAPGLRLSCQSRIEGAVAVGAGYW